MSHIEKLAPMRVRVWFEGDSSFSMDCAKASRGARRDLACEIAAYDGSWKAMLVPLDEWRRVKAIERRCIRLLDDCLLEKVTSRPWQELRK